LKYQEFPMKGQKISFKLFVHDWDSKKNV
jgi:hypothetical protein